MKTYKVTFTPLEPYFFGNEKGFKYPVGKGEHKSGNKSQFTNQYFIRSERLPSQSTLLGALRYHFLPVKKSNWDYCEAERDLNSATVGADGFDPAEDRKFGKLLKISPVFICNSEHNLVPVPMNHKTGYFDETPEKKFIRNSTYTPFEKYSEVATPLGERLYAEDYDGKIGACTDYMSLTDGAVVERTKIFTTEIRIGINRRTTRNGFFKKEYCMLQPGYSFGAFVDLEDDLEVNDGVVFLGQGKSAFAFNFVLAENTLASDVKKYLPEGVAYCLGDTFASPEIYGRSKFTVTDTKTYRVYSKKGVSVTKNDELYRVITAGSIFIPIDKEDFAKTIYKENLNRIGYNEIIIR